MGVPYNTFCCVTKALRDRIIELEEQPLYLRPAGQTDDVEVVPAVDTLMGSANAAALAANAVNGQAIAPSTVAATGVVSANSVGSNPAIRATSVGTYSGIQFDTLNVSSTLERNWFTGSNVNAYGDYAIIQSNTLGGNPISNGTIRMYIANNGNVGIGTASPAVKLDVRGGAVIGDIGGTWGVSVGGNAAGGFLGTLDGAHPLRVFTNGAEVARFASGGNVGIGTTSPTEKLDVAGGIKAQSHYSIELIAKAITASATVPLFKVGGGGGRRVSGILSVQSFNGVNISSHSYAFNIYLGYASASQLLKTGYVDDGAPIFTMGLSIPAAGETQVEFNEISAAASSMSYTVAFTHFNPASGTILTLL